MTQRPNSMKAPSAETGRVKHPGTPVREPEKEAKATAKPKVAATAVRKPNGKAVPKPKAPAAVQTKPKTKKPARKRVIFTVHAEPGSEVFVAGSFNEWKPTKHPLVDKSGKGIFERQVFVIPGTLQYKFVINGEWVIDARCSSWVPNAMGSLNSVIDVR